MVFSSSKKSGTEAMSTVPRCHNSRDTPDVPSWNSGEWCPFLQYAPVPPSCPPPFRAVAGPPVGIPVSLSQGTPFFYEVFLLLTGTASTFPS